MFEIKTLNKISPSGLECFPKDKYVCGDEFENPQAIMVRSASMHDMETGDNLLAVARAGAGVNNIPIDAMAEKGIVVFNTPGANANAVKELVLMGLFMSSRKVLDAIDWVKTIKGEGDAVGKLVEKGKAPFAGPEIQGKTLGVVGLGAIGVKVANAAVDLGMNVIGYDPYISVKAAWGVKNAVKYTASLKDIFENSDYITLHVPLTPDTKEMINSASIATMKNGVRILNFARADLVVAADVVAAAAEGKISCYVTDFPTADVIGEKNCIAIPHLGASTPESEDNCAKMAAEELIAYLENGNIINSVNLPNVTLDRSSGKRICIIHKNLPNIIASITAKISDENLNIDNMINKSRGEIAYSIFDVSGDVSAEAVKDISGLDNIIRVRVI